MKVLNKGITFDDVALTAGRTTEAISVTHMAQFAVQVSVTGTATGTLKIQASCDELEPSNWTDLSGASASLSGAAATVLINVVDAGYNWVRVVYAHTSGTGTVTSARINCKGI